MNSDKIGRIFQILKGIFHISLCVLFFLIIIIVISNVGPANKKAVDSSNDYFTDRYILHIY